MDKTIARQLIIEYIEQRYQQPYTEACSGGYLRLKFFSAETSGEKCNHRATWIASFFPELGEIVTGHLVFDITPTPIEIYLDDETGKIWEPPDPYRKITPQEKRSARKERRQARRNLNQ